LLSSELSYSFHYANISLYWLLFTPLPPFSPYFDAITPFSHFHRATPAFSDMLFIALLPAFRQPHIAITPLSSHAAFAAFVSPAVFRDYAFISRRCRRHCLRFSPLFAMPPLNISFSLLQD
jgi:hypothetical protein